MGDKLEDKGENAWTHHPTKGNNKEEKLETSRETSWETAWKTSWASSWEISWETSWETSWVTNGETSRHNIQQIKGKQERDKLGDKQGWQTSWKTSWGDRETRACGRRARHPTEGNKEGDNGRQGEIRPSGRRTHDPTTVGRPVKARFIKRFSHRHSVCLCIFYHVYEGFVVLVLGGASTPFFMGPKRCLSQFETRDLVEYPFGFFDLCDIPQKPSPEAPTQASLRDAWQQTAAPEHCVG